MTRLLYIVPIRLPTEKAHGLQIVQNCEAFADAGCEVELWVAKRRNTEAMRQIKDIHAYYGVKTNFTIHFIPCMDLLPVTPVRLERFAFYVQLWSFIIMMLLRLRRTAYDVVYSREVWPLLGLSLMVDRQRLVYEAHTLSPSRMGQRLQKRIVQRVGTVVAITPRLRDDLVALGADPARSLVAHDGIRAARFRDVPDQATARRQIGWPENAFIVGFVGRLHMIGQDKGAGALVDACQQVEGAALALVGGPDEMAEILRQQWVDAGLDPDQFLYAGHVAPDAVPLYLSAFDLCAMPHPYTRQFALYTSPLKLFEYMASRRPIVVSDLPGWADVVQHEHNALLVLPGDVDALATAIQRLRDDASLRAQLAEQAYQEVMDRYTWAARARSILDIVHAAT